MEQPRAKPKNCSRILIVDDHPVFRQGLASLVAREADLEVVGEASSAGEAAAAVSRLQPHLILLDISLPDKSGLELIKDLRLLHPHISILVISMHDEMLYAERLLRAGANGYVMKEEGPEKILEAIRRVLHRQIYVSLKMSARILNSFAGRLETTESPIARLTDREFEIFRLVGQGKDSHAIARQLNLSYKTVDTHRGHIKEKLNLGSGTELICYAARWIETGDSANKSL